MAFKVRVTSFLFSFLGCFSTFAEPLIPEIMKLKDGDLIPAKIYKQYDSREIATSLVKRLELTMEDPNGNEDFHKLNLPPQKILFDPSKDTSLQLYFPETVISEVIENGFLNLHQKPEIQGYATRIKFRNAVEEGLARLKLTKNPSTNIQSTLNLLRPKSVILEILLPKGIRPVHRGGLRYGKIVAVLLDAVKQRTTYTPYDSGAVASSPYSTDERFRKEVRPLLSRNYFFRPQHPSEYFEGEIWGELGIKDVKEFWVPSDINPEDLENLKKANINIFQYTEEKEGVEKNLYYQDYHRRRGIQIFRARFLKCESLLAGTAAQ